MSLSLEEIIDAAANKGRIDPPSSPDHVTFYAKGGVASVDQDALEPLLQFAQDEFGVSLLLAGGGAGCFRIIYEGNPPEQFRQLIASNKFRKLVADAGFDEIWLKDPHVRIPTSLVNETTEFRADFGILTPLHEEFHSLRQCLVAQSSREQIIYRGSTVYYQYSIESAFGDTHNVIATFMPRMGNASSAITTYKMIQDWNPRFLLLTGLAGALDDDFALGDVIVADEVMRYDRRSKVKEEGVQWAPTTFHADNLLLNRVKAFLIDDGLIANWKDRCLDNIAENVAQPSASVESIACGEAVVDSVGHKEEIKKLNRTCKAVEMEAGGFLEAVINQEVAGRALVIRGLSDYAAGKAETDHDQNTDWRRFAALNAAEFLVGFIQNFTPNYMDIADPPLTSSS